MEEPDQDVTLGGAQSGAGSAFAIGLQAAGRYKVLRFIASGAMGEVYAAEDLVVGVTVALKALRPELASSSSAVERLRREIALARKVTNVHVCRLHDLGEHDKRLFLTMELLDGKTLADHVKATGPLPLEEVERLAVQLVDGLAALHAAGIVHRDFKTSNTILIGERAVITDFGLARSVDGGRDAGLTAEATLLGTPAYMAPEQVEGRAATPASDIYALGVVLFELLTGAVPFREESAMATATARLHKDPPSVASLRADVPARWGAIVSRCLERDPARRFERVEDVLAGKVRRSWIPFGIGGAVLAAVAIVIAVRDDSSTTEDAACPSATEKITGVWDSVTRARIAARYEAGKPFVVDMWRAHASQLDRVIGGWTTRWDAACASNERTEDPLLHGQRIACLDTHLVEVRSYINGLANAPDAAEFARASPGEYPINPASECDGIAALRAQGPLPPRENRAEVDKLMAEGNAIRAKLRLPERDGGAVDLPGLFARAELIETRLVELGHPAGAGELRYWRVMFLHAFDRSDEGDAAATTLIQLAEETRNDNLLVRALMRRLEFRAFRRSDYSVAEGDAVIERAVALSKRLGEPVALRFDIAEARHHHMQRAGRLDQVRAANLEMATLGDALGIPYMASWHRMELAILDNDTAAAREILAENTKQLGAWNLSLGSDLLQLAPVFARTGDAATALAHARRAIAIIDAAQGTRASDHLLGAHAAALGYAIQLGNLDVARDHATGALAAVTAKGKTRSDAYAALVDELRGSSQFEAARYVLGLVPSIDNSAALANAEVHLRFDAGEALDHDVWQARLAGLPDDERHAALALVEARGKREAPALAHADALAHKPRHHAITRARVLLELDKHAEVVATLEPLENRIEPGEWYASRPRMQTYGLLGIARVELGAYPAAIAVLERVSGQFDAFGYEARFAFARALAATGNAARATKLANEARAAFTRMKLAGRAAAIDVWLATR